MGRKKKLLSEIGSKYFKSKFICSKVKKRNVKLDKENALSQVFVNNNTQSDSVVNTESECRFQIQKPFPQLKTNCIEHCTENVLRNVNIIPSLIESVPTIPTVLSENVNGSINRSNLKSNKILSGICINPIVDKNVTNNIIRGLRIVVLKKKVARTAINDILKLLKPVFPNIPLDYRTILQTPRKTKVRSVIPGKYVHFGLSSGLVFKMNQLNIRDRIIRLDFFIDGVSIHVTSKNKTFWIILARIYGFERSIIPIGLYNGPRKPDDFDDFLKSFVLELKTLLESGIVLDNINVKIEINNFNLDTPARASTIGIIGHAGYRSCVRCLCKGKRVDRRMLFKSSDSIERTDQMFKERGDLRFHSRDSLIEKELDIKMLTQFPLDFLHVVCLGVTRKFFKKLVGTEKPMFPKSRCVVDNIFEIINETLPTEIHRKFRDLKDVSTFKGHEWRIILLKIAPVLFKTTLPRKYFEHFLLLTCAFSILCDAEMCIKYNKIAHNMLKTFNFLIEILYDESMYTPMVHQSIHFAKEVLNQYKPCDKFSTWEFESYMTPIKDLIHGPRLPLSQIYRRITEYFNCPDNLLSENNENTTGKHFLNYQGFRIDTKNCRDRFFLTKQKEVIVILKINDFKEYKFTCRRLKMIDEYFKKPITASKLNFFHARTQYFGDKFIINISQIERKLICMITEKNNLFFAPIRKFT